jgi:hypothetical protein
VTCFFTGNAFLLVRTAGFSKIKFFICLTAKIGILGERPLMAQSGRSLKSLHPKVPPEPEVA